MPGGWFMPESGGCGLSGENKQAKNWMPEYADKIVYGAVAYISEDAGTAAMAEKNGLFVIKATGDSANIVNTDDFVPKNW